METVAGVLMLGIPILIMAFFIVKDEIEAAKERKYLRKTQDNLIHERIRRLTNNINR